MKNWGYIVKFEFIDPIIKKPFAFFARIFSLLGVVYSASNILKFWFGLSVLSDFFQAKKWFCLGIIVAIAIVRSRVKAEHWAHLGNGDIIVRVIQKDILNIKDSAIVIPTNTTFDTTMENNFIHEKSVQGQFQKKYFEHNLEGLNTQLSADLVKNGIPFKELKDRKQTNKRRYEVGTVAKIVQNSQYFYFLAMSDVSKTGIPQNVTMETIVQALGGLWDYLAKEGLRETITIPVIGTGRGGLQGGTFEDVYKETICSFASQSQSAFVAKELTICIYPQTLEKKSTTWERLCDYLRLQCDFFSEKQQNRAATINNGTPMN